MEKYKIWMHEVIPWNKEVPIIPGGWITREQSYANACIYSRSTDDSLAQEYSKKDAIEKIKDNKSHGYMCHAIPPIHIPAQIL